MCTIYGQLRHLASSAVGNSQVAGHIRHETRRYSRAQLLDIVASQRRGISGIHVMAIISPTVTPPPPYPTVAFHSTKIFLFYFSTLVPQVKINFYYIYSHLARSILLTLIRTFLASVCQYNSSFKLDTHVMGKKKNNVCFFFIFQRCNSNSA